MTPVGKQVKGKMVKLMCAMVGVKGSGFAVDIDDSQSVGDLKKAIKTEKANDLAAIGANKLQLYLAKKGDTRTDIDSNKRKRGAWLDFSTDDVQKLKNGDVTPAIRAMTDDDNELDAVFELKEVLDEMLPPQSKQIHVLVVVPTEEHIHPRSLKKAKYGQRGAEYHGSLGVSNEDALLPQLSEAELPRGRQLAVGDVHIPITQSMSLNPRGLVAFWQAFLDDSTDVKADTLVKLPEGTYILGDPTLGSRIYIRHCYPALWKLCLERIHDEKTNTPHLVILGNPGIGKTFFGFVILLLLARAGATVVYESGGLQKRFLFAHNVAAQGSQEDFVQILKNPATYYIVDAVKPAYYPAKTILLTSPRRSIWYEFNKTNCRSCYMPVWSLKEILQCRELMYSDTPVDVVQDCFRRWGGIARYVLRFAQVGDQQVLLEKAIDSADLDWLMNACGQLDANDAQVSHRLLHYRVNKNFDNEYLVFASKYVQQAVCKRLYEKDKRKLLELVAASDGVGAIAVLRGYLLERHVHSVLPRGGPFQVRRLVDNAEAYDDDAIMEVERDGEDEDANNMT